jgi:hypothetical protein
VTAGNVRTTDMATGSVTTRPGDIGTVRFTGLSEDVKDIEIWLPHNEMTELVSLRTDAPTEPVPESGRMVWLHHGSSVSQGSNARLTLDIIRNVLSRIVIERSVDDPGPHYLDGRELYGEADLADLPLPDQLHPDAATHRLIGRRFAEREFVDGGPLAAVSR